MFLIKGFNKHSITIQILEVACDKQLIIGRKLNVVF